MINWRGDLLDVLNTENYVSSEKAKLTIIVDLKFVDTCFNNHDIEKFSLTR